MNSLLAIVVGGLVINLITLVGGLTVLLTPRWQRRMLLPLTGLAAGSLLGGALFHMLPQGLGGVTPRAAGGWVALGFSMFLGLEQLMARQPPGRRVPAVALLVLVGDALHNFVCGVGIASTYLIHPGAGMAAWCAAAAHELPQELGDYGVLVASGWTPVRALRWNFIAGLSFPLGALLAWRWAAQLPLGALALVAAGNFLYIAAADLVPQIVAQANAGRARLGFIAFSGGLLLLWLLALTESPA